MNAFIRSVVSFLGRTATQPAFFRHLYKAGLALILLIGTQTIPSEQPGTSTTPALQDFTLRYSIDRSKVPALIYNDLTLRIYVGAASRVSTLVDGKAAAAQYNPRTGYVTITTSGSNVQVVVKQAAVLPLTGSFSKAVLKDNKKWAWSHGFDDNTGFKQYGIPAFDRYGWRATVYLIGSKLSDTRDENWIVDRPDIIRLAQKGWAIGNHTWTHAYVREMGGPSAAAQDIQKLNAYLRQAVNDAGRPNYRLMSFAAPNFDSDFLPIILAMRDNKTNQLLFDEGGSNGLLRVDPGGVEPANGVFGVFDYNQAVGRILDVDYYGTNNKYDQRLRSKINTMLGQLDDTHHYWLNTFSHEVDSKYPTKTSIFAFLPWLYKNYGPGGDNSVWVAPAEEIYSYFLVRDHAKVTFQSTAQPVTRSDWFPSVEK